MNSNKREKNNNEQEYTNKNNNNNNNETNIDLNLENYDFNEMINIFLAQPCQAFLQPDNTLS